MPWETNSLGIRFKVQRIDEHRQLRLLEFTRELTHPHWCTTGHVGYVLEGEMEVEFDHSKVVFGAGDGVIISPGELAKHRPKALSDCVRLIFVEEKPA